MLSETIHVRQGSPRKIPAQLLSGDGGTSPKVGKRSRRRFASLFLCPVTGLIFGNFRRPVAIAAKQC